MAIEAPMRPSGITRDREILEERKTRPVLGWAALGVVCLGILAYVMGGWILSGDAAHRIGPGPTPVPLYMTILARIEETTSIMFGALMLYFVVIRPWRREGHVTQDGLFVLAWLTVVWQDTFQNFLQIGLVYNSAYFNLGGWDRWIPGWIPAHGNLIIEPILWDIPFYAWGPMGGVFLACWFMGKTKARWPHMSNFRLILVTFVFGYVADLIIEPLIWIFPGVWTHTAAIKGVTLWHGHWYQFPLYEPVVASLFFTLPAFMRYFQNDKGEMICERGIDQVRVSTKQKAWIRFAALVGVLNVMFFLGYNLPYGMALAHGSDIPEDIQKRSYFMNGLCGPGTEYACPGPKTPLHKRDAAHIDPNGNVVPAGRQCRFQGCPGVPKFGVEQEPSKASK